MLRSWALTKTCKQSVVNNLLMLSWIIVIGSEAVHKDCQPSGEAKRVSLGTVLDKIRRTYYKCNRHMTPTSIDFSDKEVKQFFLPYNPSPENLKKNADAARESLVSLKRLKVNHTLLKPREERVIHQFRYLLESNFDNIYGNFYDGVYMLGPDYFCEQAMCAISSHLSIALSRIQVRTLKDLELIIFWIKEHRKSFNNFAKNMQDGVKQGMVFPKEVCKAAAKTFSKKFNKVYYKGAKGALSMGFAKMLLNSGKYFENLPEEERKRFKRKHKKTFHEVVSKAIKDDFGQPLHDLIKYVKHEHLRYCPPSNVSSGLGGLPLDYQYKDGEQTKTKTSKKLPTGETIDVSRGYEKFMSYYTTSNITADDGIELGRKLLNKYYKEVLELARNYTKEEDEEKMIEEFKKALKGKKQFYNTNPFPKNESDDDAHDRCDNDEGAKKFCPVRWSNFQKWDQSSKEIMQIAKSKIKHLFYEDGPKKTTPKCLVKLVPEYNPSNGVPSYLESDVECTEPASYFLPFFKDDMGPRYEDFNTNFHEARPGHHLQIQGFIENFDDDCGGILSWINEVADYYPSFSEGWGLYAENPILLKDVDLLSENQELEKYGVLKWQIWRALRLIVDIGMHEKGMTRHEALALFSKYAWDDSDTASKELTRYQGAPGQATSYTVGQQTIIGLRNHAKEMLKSSFSIKDFHYHLLSQGQSPFYYVSKYIDSYIACTKDNSSEKFCDIILNESGRGTRRSIRTKSPLERKVCSFFQMLKKRKYS